MTAYQTGQRFGAVLVFYVHTPRRTRYKAVTWTFWVIKWVEKIKGGHLG